MDCFENGLLIDCRIMDDFFFLLVNVMNVVILVDWKLDNYII